jgi:hypothetical protein
MANRHTREKRMPLLINLIIAILIVTLGIVAVRWLDRVIVTPRMDEFLRLPGWEPRLTAAMQADSTETGA